MPCSMFCIHCCSSWALHVISMGEKEKTKMILKFIYGNNLQNFPHPLTNRVVRPMYIPINIQIKDSNANFEEKFAFKTKVKKWLPTKCYFRSMTSLRPVQIRKSKLVPINPRLSSKFKWIVITVWSKMLIKLERINISHD